MACPQVALPLTKGLGWPRKPSQKIDRHIALRKGCIQLSESRQESGAGAGEEEWVAPAEVELPVTGGDNGGGLAEGEAVRLEALSIGDVVGVDEGLSEGVNGGGSVRVKKEEAKVDVDEEGVADPVQEGHVSAGGAVKINLEDGVDVNEEENVYTRDQHNGDWEREDADDETMTVLGYVSATIRGVNHCRAVVRKQEILLLTLGLGIDVKNHKGERVGAIEAPLGRYLRPLLEDGIIHTFATVKTECRDGYTIPAKVWIHCQLQDRNEVLRRLHLRSQETNHTAVSWELLRTDSFERTVPTPRQSRILEEGGTWNGEGFESYEELNKAINDVKKKLGFTW